MRPLLLTTKAMTLTELIVSSILVMIVITGALSADFAVRSWQKRMDKRTFCQLGLGTAMTQILKEGRATAGFGIVLGSALSDAAITAEKTASPEVAMLRFRQDPDPTVEDDENYIEYRYVPPLSNGIHRRECSFDWVCSPYVQFYKSTDPFNFFTLNFNGASLESITIYLETRPDPDSLEDPVKNPTYSVETSFLPTGFSQ